MQPIRVSLIVLSAMAVFWATALAQTIPPYVAGFESSEGFSVATLAGQNGWTVPQGTASIVGSVFSSGALSVELASGTPLTQVSKTFAAQSGVSVTFIDFFARPIAGTAPANLAWLEAEGASIGLFQIDPVGQVIAFDGDGSGGGKWIPTRGVVTVDAAGAATNWVRFTVRQDYTARKWDLYLDGEMVAAGLGMKSNTATFLSLFKISGASGGATHLDDVYVGDSNPLFVDADGDGMEDAWESAHGLSTTTVDRAGDLDGDGISNVDEYARGTNPNATDSDGDGLPDAWEVAHGTNPLANDASADPGEVGRTLTQSYASNLSPWPTATVSSGLQAWYRADKGVSKDGSGRVSQWKDVSGHLRHLVQSAGSAQPLWQANATYMNGRAAIQFDTASRSLLSAMTDLLQGSDDITIFAVLQPSATTPPADTTPFEFFGDFAFQQNGASAHLYRFLWPSASGTQGGALSLQGSGARTQVFTIQKSDTTQTLWLDGVQSATGAVASTIQKPLSRFGVHSFVGLVAEILVYNRALTSVERGQVEAALNLQYVDSDQDGLPDAWETQNFGGLGQSGSGDFDSDGLTNAQELALGTNPANADTDVDGVKDGLEQTLGMNPLMADLDTLPSKLSGRRLHLIGDTGVAVDGSGNVSTWQDQSGLNNHATQTTSGQRPALVASTLNGHAIARFDGTDDCLNLPNFMSGATSGEAFIVLKVTVDMPSQNRSLWKMGTGAGSDYPNSAGHIVDDFGSNGQIDTGDPIIALDTYHVYDVSAQSGLWENRINGGILYSTKTNTLGFRSDPVLGRNDYNKFAGDVAEFIVFNRILSADEREALTRYCAVKYALSVPSPAAPTALTGTAVSASQVSLTWSAGAAGVGVIYEIERKVGSAPFAFVADVADATSYVDGGLAASTTYAYRIRARTPAGISTFSSTANATTMEPTTSDLPSAGRRLWLKADGGIASLSSGRVLHWSDLSGLRNHARQAATTSLQPLWITNAVNGRPVVRFDGVDDYLQLSNFMSSATAGEIFIVLKAAADIPAGNRSLWKIGTSAGSDYPNSSGIVYDDFGSTTQRLTGDPVVALDTYHLYNVTAQTNSWVSRINGSIHHSSASNTVAFRSDPILGKNDFNRFPGDVAEIIAYDHALTAGERETVTRYLAQKYALAVAAANAPTGVVGQVVSGSQISLTWSPSSTGAGVIYEVQRRSGAGAFASIADVSDATHFMDAGLTASTNYTYRVRARTPAGLSAFSAETTATTFASTATDFPTAGMKLWLKAEASYAGADQARVLIWPDQSGLKNDARQYAATGNQPRWVASGVNGRPVIRFDGNDDYFDLANFMSGATAGEVFIVLKAAADMPPSNRSLWKMGASAGADYPTSSGIVYDDFGSTSMRATGDPVPSLSSFHLYNVSAQSGLWESRFNGSPHFSITSNTVAFRSDPILGKNDFNKWPGDIAEIIAYNRVLSLPEREAINRLPHREVRGERNKAKRKGC